MKGIWIADGHCDSLGDYSLGKRDLKTAETGQWDLAKARKGNVGLQFLAAFIESEYKPYLATWRGLQLLEAGLRFIEGNPEDVFLLKNKSDLDKLGNTDFLGIILHVEGGEILGESLFMLDIIFRLGVRSLGLTWNERNALGDGVGEASSNSGLSSFGIKVVERMNQLGMLVDVSHLNERGFWDVLEKSSKPVIASHSCARSICNHPRNLSDEQLRALAAQKGLVGVNFCVDFLNENGRASIEDVIKHICYISEKAGVDSVGLGSDFDGIPYPPKGLESPEMFPVLQDKLALCGFSQTEIIKICHGNFVRVLKNVLE